MSDDFFKGANPFSKLSKKQYPSAQKISGKIVRQTEKPKPSPVVQGKDDSDESLFMDAVANAVPLDKSKAAHQKKNKNIPPSTACDPRKESETIPPAAPAEKAVRPLPAPNNAPEDFSVLLAESMPEALTKHPLSQKRPQRKNAGIAEKDSQRIQEPKTLDIPSNLDDEGAFASAMQGVTPLEGKGRSIQPEPVLSPTPTVSDKSLQDLIDGKIEFSLAATDEYVEGHVVGLDLSIVGKLQAGQFSPEAHLDMHGLNAEQAFMTLVGFIKRSYLCGRRNLLVIPGRGKNSPAGVGILRERLQEWLTQEPFRRVILAFCTAKRVDGGPGALYVLLRKYRKDHGKVQWNRTPSDPDLLL